MSPLKSLTLALAIALPALSLAQTQDIPLRIGFQGRLLASDGTPLTGLKQVTFRIYSSATGGTPRWAETQQLLLTSGYYATFLGASTPLGTTAAPATSIFDGSDLFLGVEVAGAELTPRQQIGSVAYAIRAAQAVHADRASEADHAARASAADQVSTTWLASQSVAHADLATSVGGGTVTATSVSARTLSTSDKASLASVDVTGSSKLNGLTAVNTSVTTLTVGGTATMGAVSAGTLLHVPGAVVGGYYYYQTGGAYPTEACNHWGDGTCSDCKGGTHPSGYVYGEPVQVGEKTYLCIQR